MTVMLFLWLVVVLLLYQQAAAFRRVVATSLTSTLLSRCSSSSMTVLHNTESNDADDMNEMEGFEIVSPSKDKKATTNTAKTTPFSKEKKSKVIIATFAALIGLTYNVFTHSASEETNLELLKRMEQESATFEVRSVLQLPM